MSGHQSYPGLIVCQRTSGEEQTILFTMTMQCECVRGEGVWMGRGGGGVSKEEKDKLYG